MNPSGELKRHCREKLAEPCKETIRKLHRPERGRKRRRDYEQMIVNLTRKPIESWPFVVYVPAENPALAPLDKREAPRRGRQA